MSKEEHEWSCECFECFKKKYEGMDIEYVLSCLYAKRKELNEIYEALQRKRG